MSMLEKWEDMTARKAAVSLEEVLSNGGVTLNHLRRQEKDHDTLKQGPGRKSWPVAAEPIKFETIKSYWGVPHGEQERKYVLRIKAGEGLRPPGRAPLCPDAELWMADVVSVMILRDEPLHDREIKKMAKAMFIELGLKDICGRPYTKDTCMDERHGVITRFKSLLPDVLRQRLRFNCATEGTFRLPASDIVGCCEMRSEEMLGLDEEQQHLRRAMEKVGWFADSDSELQYDLTKTATEKAKQAEKAKRKIEKELQTMKNHLSVVKTAEADLEARLKAADGDVAKVLKSLRAVTTLKDYVFSRQDARARSAMRTLNKTQLGEQWMARIKSPRVDYDTPIAAKASDLESLTKDISNAEEELEVAHKILQHNEEWHEEHARQLMEVKDTMAERQNAASHES
eukprot:jgi/Tetstr1/449659/TSEL_036727.t1